jgi:hypothetical protein
MICITESLLLPLEARMETYRQSTGSQFNVIFKKKVVLINIVIKKFCFWFSS